jgi:hypothetical protein
MSPNCRFSSTTYRPVIPFKGLENYLVSIAHPARTSENGIEGLRKLPCFPILTVWVPQGYFVLTSKDDT